MVKISAGSAATGRRLRAAAGREDWANEPRFARLDGFAEHMDEIVGWLTEPAP